MVGRPRTTYHLCVCVCVENNNNNDDDNTLGVYLEAGSKKKCTYIDSVIRYSDFSIRTNTLSLLLSYYIKYPRTIPTYTSPRDRTGAETNVDRALDSYSWLPWSFNILGTIYYIYIQIIICVFGSFVLYSICSIDSWRCWYRYWM